MEVKRTVELKLEKEEIQEISEFCNLVQFICELYDFCEDCPFYKASLCTHDQSNFRYLDEFLKENGYAKEYEKKE